MATTTKHSLWAAGYDETVEVNQRALIDKILARYSGEFSVFRELLQNSDDASSKAIEIRFETKEYIDSNRSSMGQAPSLLDELPPDLSTTFVHKWSYKNNGVPFRDEDWSRLKKIAEGNPDEQKIGAFGVGFYSLFSVTEKPFVTSGGQWMGFYWKDGKDQLFVRRGNTSGQTNDPWTTFEVDLREPAPIPAAFDFIRFLVSSITFMVHIREVGVYFDDKRLAHLTKDVGIPKRLAIPSGLSPTSALEFMRVEGLKSTPMHITAEVANSVYITKTQEPKQVLAVEQTEHKTGFFYDPFGLGGSTIPQQAAPPPSPQPVINEAGSTEIGQHSVALTIFTAEVDVKLSQKMFVGLRRSIKKNPPRKLEYDLLYMEKDEYDVEKERGGVQPNTMGNIFQGLCPDLDGSGSARVFIGHATAQTTGLGGHMATRFIPTVERESIDLVDKNVAVWNKELLFVGGFLARAAYESEMQDIKTQWDASAASKKPDEHLDSGLYKKFYDKAKYNLQFFTFRASTPSPLVSSQMQSAFFNCGIGRQPFPIISSAGVKSAFDVRMPNSALSAFLPGLPMFPEELLDDSKSMVKALQEKGMLKIIVFTEVLKGLRERPLSEEKMVACLQWWVDKYRFSPEISSRRQELLDAATVTIGSSEGGNKQEIPLKGIQTFLDPKTSSAFMDGPFPEHLLPISISQKLGPIPLQQYLQWKQLTVLEWVQYIVDPAMYNQKREFNIVESPAWADHVLQVLGKCWPTLLEINKANIVVGLLSKLTCIPTSAGMKLPSEAYFPSADILHNLPVVNFPSGTRIWGGLEEMLADLGVQRHADLRVIFDQLIKTGHWTTRDLVKYLISVLPTLRHTEVERLRCTPAFPAEATTEQNTNEDGTLREVQKFKASDLYEPLDVFRVLGLPAIDWQGKDGRYKWSPDSEEAQFLFNIGLRRYPPIEFILGIAAKSGRRRRAALDYFLDNYWHYANHIVDAHKSIAFVPTVYRGKETLGSPLKVFSNPDWQLLGFRIMYPALRQDAVSKLGIKEHPPTSQLVHLLEVSPPTTEAQACEWFQILSRHIPDFHKSELAKLSTMRIVPIPDSSLEPICSRLLPPNQCYFKNKSNGQAYSKLFVFVDFGASANSFLYACGMKEEPSVEDIAMVLLKDPQQFLQSVEGWNGYLAELRNIATNRQSLNHTTLARFKEVGILVGFQRVQGWNSGKVTDHATSDGEDHNLEPNLLTPDQVVIADDIIALQQFGEEIFCAPQEEILEGFYISLGCKRLSDLVQKEYGTTQETHGNRKAQDIKSLVLERLPLFLHEHNHTTTRVSLTWLNDKGNFVVRTFKRLTVTRNINFAGIKLSKSTETSAVVTQEGKGAIQLWLTDDMEVDMYDIATSFCHLFFDTYKKRGYNVSRILKQQKTKKDYKRALIEKANKVKKANKPTSVLPSPSPVLPPAPAPTPLPKPSTPLPKPSTPLPKPSTPVPKPSTPVPKSSTPVPGPFTPVPRPSTNTDQSNITPKTNLSVSGSQGQSKPGPVGYATQKFSPGDLFVVKGPEDPVTGSELVITFSAISEIYTAIKACKEEDSDLIHGRVQQQKVKGNLCDDYCDISGDVGDLVRLREMEKIALYFSKDIPDPTKLLEEKKDILSRFIGVMVPILDIYRLPLTKIHLFYDLAGSAVTFNRNGSIFMNLRFYEEWHDGQVRNGNLSKAYASWYFTLAHGITHNRVQSHGAQHEFYFSLICQEFLPGLSELTLG